MIFYYLFLQDVFTGTYSREKHKRTHVIFGALLVATQFFFVGLPGLVDPAITDVLAYIPMMVLIVSLGIWQLRVASKLKKKTSEKRARIGISMIGNSAIFYLLIIVVVGLKKAWFYLDLGLSILLFLWSIVTYMGYVYPSMQKDPASK